MRKTLLSGFLIIGLMLSIFSCRDARIHEHKDWAEVYQAEGVKNAGVIIRDQSHDAVHYFNLDRDTAEILPASTFKIMLSLVGLELGIVQDDKFIIPFTGDSSGRSDWDKDLSLREAFKVSSEPFFKELARRIGRERLLHFIDSCNYGNKTIGDSVSTCWTDNTLKISADEQVGFVRRLYFNQLPFTDRSQRIVRSMMLRDKGNGRKLYYKTGWGYNNNGQNNVLWIVGYAEYEIKLSEQVGSMNKSDERNYVYFFAQNFDVPATSINNKDWAELRLKFIDQILNKTAQKAIK